MPPAWYPDAKEGDEHDVGGTKWFVQEVNGDVIWWSRTRYGRAEACSQRKGAESQQSAVARAYQLAMDASCLQVDVSGPTKLQGGRELEYQVVVRGGADTFKVAEKGDAVWTQLEPNSYFPGHPGVARMPVTEDRRGIAFQVVTSGDGVTAFYERPLPPIRVCNNEELADRVASYWQKRHTELLLRSLQEDFGESENATHENLMQALECNGSCLLRHDGKKWVRVG